MKDAELARLMLDCGGTEKLGRVVDDAGPPVVGVEPIAGEPDGEVDEAPEDAVAPPETPVAVDDPAEPGSPVAADDPAVGPVDGARLDVADPPPGGDVTAAELLGVATTDAGPINCGSARPPEQAPAASSATANTIPASARNGLRPRAAPARPEVLARARRGSSRHVPRSADVVGPVLGIVTPGSVGPGKPDVT